jgi:hypothetical protein
MRCYHLTIRTDVPNTIPEQPIYAGSQPVIIWRFTLMYFSDSNSKPQHSCFLKRTNQLSYATHVTIKLMLFFELHNFESYIVYLTLQTFSNKKLINRKAVDLVKYYNFVVDFITIRHS